MAVRGGNPITISNGQEEALAKDQAQPFLLLTFITNENFSTIPTDNDPAPTKVNQVVLAKFNYQLWFVANEFVTNKSYKILGLSYCVPCAGLLIRRLTGM